MQAKDILVGLLFWYTSHLAFPSAAYAQDQQKRPTIVVIDKANGQALPGANAFLDAEGAASDASGIIAFPAVEDGRYPLIVRYIGYEPYEDSVTVSDGSARPDTIRLVPRAYVTDEALVVGRRDDPAMRIMEEMPVMPHEVTRGVGTINGASLEHIIGIFNPQAKAFTISEPFDPSKGYYWGHIHRPAKGLGGNEAVFSPEMQSKFYRDNIPVIYPGVLENLLLVTAPFRKEGMNTSFNFNQANGEIIYNGQLPFSDLSLLSIVKWDNVGLWRIPELEPVKNEVKLGLQGNGFEGHALFTRSSLDVNLNAADVKQVYLQGAGSFEKQFVFDDQALSGVYVFNSMSDRYVLGEDGNDGRIYNDKLVNMLKLIDIIQHGDDIIHAGLQLQVNRYSQGAELYKDFNNHAGIQALRLHPEEELTFTNMPSYAFASWEHAFSDRFRINLGGQLLHDLKYPNKGTGVGARLAGQYRNEGFSALLSLMQNMVDTNHDPLLQGTMISREEYEENYFPTFQQGVLTLSLLPHAFAFLPEDLQASLRLSYSKYLHQDRNTYEYTPFFGEEWRFYEQYQPVLDQMFKQDPEAFLAQHPEIGLDPQARAAYLHAMDQLPGVKAAIDQEFKKYRQEVVADPNRQTAALEAWITNSGEQTRNTNYFVSGRWAVERHGPAFDPKSSYTLGDVRFLGKLFLDQLLLGERSGTNLSGTVFLQVSSGNATTDYVVLPGLQDQFDLDPTSIPEEYWQQVQQQVPNGNAAGGETILPVFAVLAKLMEELTKERYTTGKLNQGRLPWDKHLTLMLNLTLADLLVDGLDARISAGMLDPQKLNPNNRNVIGHYTSLEGSKVKIRDSYDLDPLFLFSVNLRYAP